MDSMDEVSPPPSSFIPLFHVSPSKDRPGTGTPVTRDVPPASRPPQASIAEEVEPRPQQVTNLQVLDNVELPVYEDIWVVVYGFQPQEAVLSAVLREFQSCGTIVAWRRPPSLDANWIYLNFEDAAAAQRAILRNGSMLGSWNIRVGVQPLTAHDRAFVQTRGADQMETSMIKAANPQRHYLSVTSQDPAVAIPQIASRTWGEKVRALFWDG